MLTQLCGQGKFVSVYPLDHARVRRQYRDQYETQFKKEVALLFQFRGKPHLQQFQRVVYDKLAIEEPRAEFDLHDLIHDTARFNPAVARRAIRHVCRGMGALHELGVLVRDLKIENVLCFKDRERNLCFRIADFNIYQQNLLCPIEMHKGGDPKDKSGTHFAPEEVDKENFGLSADVWRFGVLVFLLTNNDHDKTDAYEAVCDDKKRYDKMVGRGAHLVADPRERVAGPSMAAFWTAEEKKWK